VLRREPAQMPLRKTVTIQRQASLPLPVRDGSPLTRRLDWGQMPSMDQMQTRLSLLLRPTRAGPCDEPAWPRFVDHYGPMIFRWCQRHNLQETDAKDVTQQVMLKLATHLPAFSYDPTKSFRAWLRTLTHHAWVDFLADQRQRGSGDTSVFQILSSVECRDDLL